MNLLLWKEKNMADYFEETFFSPFEGTMKEAFKVLDEIRECHSAEHGWEELDAGLVENPDGSYTPYRRHRKARS